MDNLKQILLTPREMALIIMSVSVFMCETHNFIIACRANYDFDKIAKNKQELFESLEKLKEMLIKNQHV